MELIRFEPGRPVARPHQGRHPELGRRLDASVSRPASASTACFRPAVDIAQSAEAILLRVEVPGLRREQIDIELDHDLLILRGRIEGLSDNADTQTWIRRERRAGSFERRFALNVAIDRDAVTATLRDGVLEIHLPKSASAGPRLIEVVEGR